MKKTGSEYTRTSKAEIVLERETLIQLWTAIDWFEDLLEYITNILNNEKYFLELV